MKDYQILVSSHASGLEKEVNLLLAVGYDLVGAVFFANNAFYQAVIRVTE